MSDEKEYRLQMLDKHGEPQGVARVIAKPGAIGALARGLRRASVVKLFHESAPGSGEEWTLAPIVDLDGYVELQKHRDAWRQYAYGKGDKPQDFLDGNMADRPLTRIESLERMVEALVPDPVQREGLAAALRAAAGEVAP